MPEQAQVTEPKFDLKVHHFDARGRVKKKTHYRLHIHKGTSMFERPVNSGNLFYENNEPAGRVIFTRDEKGAIIGKKYEPNATHLDFKAPLSAEEKVHFENEQMRSRIAALEAELAAVEADKEAKAAAVKTPAPVAAKPAAAQGGGQPTANGALMGAAKKPLELPEI